MRPSSAIIGTPAVTVHIAANIVFINCTGGPLDPLTALPDERLMAELQGGIAERKRLLELQLEQVTKLKEERLCAYLLFT